MDMNWQQISPILSTDRKIIMLFAKNDGILFDKTHDYAILTFQGH